MRRRVVISGLAVLTAFAIACGVGTSKKPVDIPATKPTIEMTDIPAGTQTTIGAATTAPAKTTSDLLTVPKDLVGMNAQLAYEELERIGFTSIDFASADKDDTIVLYPPNWHVVKVEPRAGTKLSPDDTIILTCSKQ
ncbi:MAG TPA: PASTA domain-containing protein [Micromonosporaceae bacterium]|jgi:beta-lactam-binding protein with PASTA domain